MALKEEQPIVGRSIRFGSLLTEGWVSEETHPVAERVLGAGAIVHARTTTPEFSCAAFTHSDLWGITRNPWNPDFGPGGSSGGSGAALASGTAYLASGSDIGGSIRIPASLNGVVGFKPPYGRVPAMAPFNLDTYCHDGPMGRTVADVALFQNVIQGQHPHDHVSLPAVPIPDELGDVRGRRVALAVTLGDFPVDPEVEANTRTFADALRAAGAIVDEVTVAALPRRGHASSAGALRLDHGSVDARVQRAGRLALHALHPALPRAVERGVRPVGFYAGSTIEARVHRALATVFVAHDALICPTLGTTGFEAGDDYTEHGITVAGEYVDLYIFAGAHAGVQRRQPPPRAQRPVRSRSQRRPDRASRWWPVPMTTSPRSTSVPPPSASSGCGPTRPGVRPCDEHGRCVDVAVNVAASSLGPERSTQARPARPSHRLAVALRKDVLRCRTRQPRRKLLGRVGVGAVLSP